MPTGHGAIYIYLERSRPAGVAQSRHALVGGKQKAEKASEMPIKHSPFVGNMQIG